MDRYENIQKSRATFINFRKTLEGGLVENIDDDEESEEIVDDSLAIMSWPAKNNMQGVKPKLMS